MSPKWRVFLCTFGLIVVVAKTLTHVDIGHCFRSHVAFFKKFACEFCFQPTLGAFHFCSNGICNGAILFSFFTVACGRPKMRTRQGPTVRARRVFPALARLVCGS